MIYLTVLVDKRGNMLEKLKAVFFENGFDIESEKEIQYGVQFKIIKNEDSGLIRFFSGKKGDKVDLSQLKNEGLKDAVIRVLQQSDACGSLVAHLVVTKSSSGDNVSTQTGLFDESSLQGDLIGVDESGKGDYFGPLVIASVFVSQENAETLKAMGVMDSKRIHDEKIIQLSHQIKAICPFDLVSISNPKYNELYASFRNLNTLLAWGHARTIENILSRVSCDRVLCDQFGRDSLIKNALMEKGQAVTLLQRHKAESVVSVAAASIVAREGYITDLAKLSHEYGLSFPKGISQKTIACVKAFETKFGKAALPEVSKSHFKLKGL